MQEFPPSHRTDEVPSGFDPIANGLLRSVKGLGDEWYATIDMDGGAGLTNTMLEAAYAIYRAEKETRRPVIKGSGQKGVQLYWRTKIENEATAPAIMRDWIYTKYKKLEIEDSYDIGFGRDSDYPERPHIDLSMFQPMRMWRVFCTRMTGRRPNGRYSVPLSLGDDLETAQAKMNMDLRLTYEVDVVRGQVTNLERDITHRFDYTAYREANLPTVAVPPKDAIEARLTPMLRAIIHQPKVEREHRYGLVSYMYCYMGIRDVEEIYNFIMERTEWDKKDPATMRYQIRTSIQTCESRFPEKPVPSFVWREPDGS